MANTTKDELLDALLDRVDSAIERGEKLPWQKNWDPKYGSQSAPHNPTTGKSYSLENSLILDTAAMANGYVDPRWMGYNQAKDQGWQVRKGEKAAARIFSPLTKTEINPKTGKEETVVFGYRGIPVWNAEQIDGIQPMQEVPENERLPKSAELDAIARQMGVDVLHSGNRAFYTPQSDRIQLPDRESFHSQYAYDSVKAHELSHATGHESRLNRESMQLYATPKERAAEEMTAEIGAYLLATRLGVPFSGENPDLDTEQHAAYLVSWGKNLSRDERRAAVEAGVKAAGYLQKQLEIAKERGLIMEVSKEVNERNDLSTEKGKETAMETENMKKTIVEHNVVLTSRKDLDSRSYIAEYPDITEKVVNHPAQLVSGTLESVRNGYLHISNPQIGEGRISVFPPVDDSMITFDKLYVTDDANDLSTELSQHEGSRVDIEIDDEEKNLSITIHGKNNEIKVLNGKIATPLPPRGLLDEKEFEKIDLPPIEGELVRNYGMVIKRPEYSKPATRCYEVRQNDGNSVLVLDHAHDKEDSDINKLIGKQVRISPKGYNYGEVSLKITDVALEKQQELEAALKREAEKNVEHNFYLTHRKDLADYSYKDTRPSKDGLGEEAITVVNHPVQRLEGTLTNFSKSAVELDTEKFGKVWLETNKRIFANEPDVLREAIGSTAEVSISGNGKTLSFSTITWEGDKGSSTFHVGSRRSSLPRMR
jgi:antirestriction protein ArdC